MPQKIPHHSDAVPRVSLLVAMRNEARYINPCLASLLSQDYPEESLEILVLDGKSNDGSWQIVEEIFKGRPNCYLIDNSEISQAHGWNLGIKRSTGQIIGIVSAHSELALDYVSMAVETLQRTGADLVGGPMCAHSVGIVGKAIAAATSTPFGVGGARFHYTEREEEVDTVYMGLCWKNTYQRIGGFDVEMVRNQDDELSYRLLDHGGRIICNPAIRSLYHNRATMRSLWTQYFQYGYWKIRVMEKHWRQMRPRHFIPSTFVVSLLGSIMLAPLTPIGTQLFVLVAGTYVLCNFVVSILTIKQNSIRTLPLLPIVFITLHLSYGLGFLKGAFDFLFFVRR